MRFEEVCSRLITSTMQCPCVNMTGKYQKALWNTYFSGCFLTKSEYVRWEVTMDS